MINTKIITFDKSALKDICKLLKVPYDKHIAGFTKEGVVKDDLCSLIQLSDKIEDK